MTHRNRALLMGLALGAASTFASAQNPCAAPQGNLTLGINGLPNVGSTLRFNLTGTPYSPIVLAVDTDPGPQVLPGIGTLCLSPALKFLTSSHEYVRISGLGDWNMDATIPDDPALAGLTVHFQAASLDASAPFPGIVLSNSTSVTLQAEEPVETIYFEDFEAGIQNWIVTNGVWNVGTPTSGPSEPWSGVQCAATNLSGDYPHYDANTTFMSDFISLPALSSPGEEIRVNHRVWFGSEDGRDYMRLRVSTDAGATWTTIGNQMSGSNSAWVQASADLTPYAGQLVWLGFQFVSGRACTSSSCTIAGPGFYIDDIHVFRGTPFFNAPEDWEGGIGYWWKVTNGLWEVGPPTAGPCPPSSGTNVVGTRLDGNYPHYDADTRLVSPQVTLPVAPFVRMFFQHCFQTETGRDVGYVQVLPAGETSWTNVAGPFSGNSQGWTQTAADLTAYAGQTVRVGFFFTSSRACTSSSCTIGGAGWFIDDIRF